MPVQKLNFIGQPAENLNHIGGTDDCGWRQVVHPDDYDRVAARWLHSLRTGEPYESEYRIRRADGAYRWSAMLRCHHAMTTVELSAGTV
jgi:PAS domain-containing protein